MSTYYTVLPHGLEEEHFRAHATCSKQKSQSHFFFVFAKTTRNLCDGCLDRGFSVALYFPRNIMLFFVTDTRKCKLVDGKVNSNSQGAFWMVDERSSRILWLCLPKCFHYEGTRNVKRVRLRFTKGASTNEWCVVMHLQCLKHKKSKRKATSILRANKDANQQRKKKKKRYCNAKKACS